MTEISEKVESMKGKEGISFSRHPFYTILPFLMLTFSQIQSDIYVLGKIYSERLATSSSSLFPFSPMMLAH